MYSEMETIWLNGHSIGFGWEIMKLFANKIELDETVQKWERERDANKNITLFNWYSYVIVTPVS